MLKSKGLIIVSALIITTSALGGVSGWFLGTMFKPVPEQQNKVYFDEPVVFSNNIESVKKILDGAKINDISKINEVDVTLLIGVNGITIGDIAEVSQLLLYKNENAKMISNNFATSNAMGIVNDQETNSTWIKKDDFYFKENVSYSRNASFGERSYNFNNEAIISPLINPFDNYIEYFRVIGNTNCTNVSFLESAKSSYLVNSTENDLDSEGNQIKSYSSTFGLSLYKPFNYDFSEDNLLKNDNGEYVSCTLKNSKTNDEFNYMTSITSTENGYEINLVMDVKALENYASYIYTTTRDASQIAKMKKKPEFKNAGVKLVVDKNLLIQSMHIDEDYDVISNLVGNVPTICSSDLVFEYENTTIPSIKETITYEG